VEEFAFKAGIKLLHVPFRVLRRACNPLLGGPRESHSDSTGWARTSRPAPCRLLATCGAKRRSAAECAPRCRNGYETLADSPFGIAGPRGMEPAVTNRLRRFQEDTGGSAVLATFDKYDQSVIYMNANDYTRFLREQYVKEKVIIERLGLALKAR